MTQRIPGPGGTTSRASRAKRTWLSGRRRVILPIATVAIVLGSAGTALACITPPGGGWPPISQPPTPTVTHTPYCGHHKHHRECPPTPPVTTPPTDTPPTSTPPTSTPTVPPTTAPPVTVTVTQPPVTTTTTVKVTPSKPTTTGGGKGCTSKSSGGTCKVVTGTPNFTG